MNRRKSTPRAVAIAVLSIALAGTAFAQTVLKFSHTDQQAGARQAAVLVIEPHETFAPVIDCHNPIKRQHETSWRKPKFSKIAAAHRIRACLNSG